MSPSITASILYDLVQCPHRIYMDHFEDPAKRDPTNPFVELLWEWGSAFEKEVIENLSIPFENLFDLSGPEKEQRVFARAWEYLRSSRNRVIYYYSPYERTIWRKLQQKYPNVMTETDMEDLFSPESAVDLYKDVVRVKTEWPTRDYSIKTLASYLGFQWRDTNPSGAASIEWYHRWVEGADTSVQQRILDYNEDDCRATRVLLDAIRELDVKGAPA